MADVDTDSNLVETTSTEVTGTAEGIRFDAEKMAQARDYIVQAYDVLSTSLKQINEEKFPMYIDEGSGIFLKIPTLSNTLKEIWENNVVVQLNDFMSHYSEWSNVMTMTQVAASEYTTEATATYSKNLSGEIADSLSEYTGTKIEDLVLPLDDNSRANIRNIVSGFTENPNNWSAQVSNMSAEEKKYLMDVLRSNSETDYYTYKYAMKHNDSSRIEEFKSTIPPEEYAMIVEKYNEEIGAA